MQEIFAGEGLFVTAYDKYALKAFAANALDYLTKPVSPPRLAVTVARLQNRLLATGAAPKDEPQASTPSQALEMRDLILLR